MQSPKSNVQEPVRTGSGSGGVTSTKDIPIISSEWGYSAVWPNVNEEKQGELLARTFLTNVSNGVSLSIWYDWRDDGLNPNEPEHHFGTVSNFYHENRKPVYDPKPAYLAARTLAAFFSGYRFERRVDVGVAEDYVLAFRKGNELRFAVWTTANRARRVLLPLSAGEYTSVTHKGQGLRILSGDQKGVAIDLTTAPIYLRPKN
jgi:hypothetical protein